MRRVTRTISREVACRKKPGRLTPQRLHADIPGSGMKI
jgi:hypothetical protein